MVYRIFVEKKAGLDNEARALLSEATNLLGVQGLQRVRLFNRYDAENITDSSRAERDIKQAMVENGEIAAVVIEDSATLKRVHYRPEEGVLTLMAENPRYQPLVYSGEELSRIQILGKAVAFQSRRGSTASLK